MRRTLGTGLLLLTLTSCTTLMAAKHQSATLTTPQERTYHCAVQTMLAMGGIDLHSDQSGGIASCTLHGAIAMTARITPDGKESRIDVTGTPIPGKIALGSFSEVEEFVAKVQECR